MQRLTKIRYKGGFTLIEMLIVILIIVVLIAIAVPAISGYRRDSEATADLGAAKTVYTALEATITQVKPTLGSDGTFPAFLTAGTTGVSIPTVDFNGDGVNDYYLHTTLRPGVHSTGEFLSTFNSLVGSVEFTGWYRFGYDPVSSSILWVTYHKGDTSSGSAAPGKVMLYDPINNVSGYLDDPDLATYNVAPYTHP